MSIKGQSAQKLDVKYGFKQFKFGMHISQIRNIAKNDSALDKNPNVEEYLYTGKDLNSLYDVKVWQISLTFYKKRLYMIMISLGSPTIGYTDAEFNLVQYSLEKVFGEKTFRPSNESGAIVKGFVWKGKSVTLEHFKVDYSKDYNDNLNHSGGYIDVYENTIQNQRLNDEF